MKVIALVPFKNEAHILPTYFSSLVGIVDIVIGFDDGSIDDSRKIFNSLGGQIIDRHDVPDWGNGGQRFVRELLLKSGRIAGGTHFICLDADEALSSNFNNSAKSKIEKMNPGEKIALKWITLWKDLDHYCGLGAKIQRFHILRQTGFAIYSRFSPFFENASGYQSSCLE